MKIKSRLAESLLEESKPSNEVEEAEFTRGPDGTFPDYDAAMATKKEAPKKKRVNDKVLQCQECGKLLPSSNRGKCTKCGLSDIDIAP